MLKPPFALLLAVMLGMAALARPAPAAAADVFPVGATGYDISFPQCNLPLPALPYGFAIVGATGGKAFTGNPCLTTQYAWAAANGRVPSLYMNLKSPVGSNAEEAATGPAGTCGPTDDRCRAYNFGYKTAQHAVTYAKTVTAAPASWWLDIETTSSWSTDTAANTRVIEGAIDYLRTLGATIGIYSNPSQWQTIAGSFAPGLPVWTTTAPGAAEAPTFCSKGFAGGQVVLVQYLQGGFDTNYACRAEDRTATASAGTPVGPVGAAATIAAEGDCLNVRVLPSTSAPRSTCLATGTTVTLMDGAVVSDGYRWQLISAASVSGWVASTYLRLGAASSTPSAPSVVTPPAPPTGTFVSAPLFSSTRQALVVFSGGTVDQLESAAIGAGATGVWAQDASGVYQLYVVRGPAFVNGPFRASFSSGLRTLSALTLTR